MLDRACITCSKFLGEKRSWRASTARCRCFNARQAKRLPYSGYLPVARYVHVVGQALRLPSCLRSFRRFCPRISQRGRTVPDLFLRRRIWVEREIAKTLKLIAFFWTCIRQCGFAF